MDKELIRQILDADTSEMSATERAKALVKKISICRSLKNAPPSVIIESDYDKAVRLMHQVSWLSTREEKEMYVSALMGAMRWGHCIDRERAALFRTVIELAGGEEPARETMTQRRERILRSFERHVSLNDSYKEQTKTK